MARETIQIVRCDAAFTARPKECGEEHEDNRTFRIAWDGETWDIELGGPHAQALIAIAQRGRAIPTSTSPSTQALNRRIRNVPIAE